MSCPDCEELKKTNKVLHRRLQKAESSKAQVFKQHNPVLAELDQDAHRIKEYAGKLRKLYKKEWRQFQLDDPLFKEKYELYCTKASMYQQFKNWIVKGK